MMVLILVVVEDGLVLSSPRMPPNRGNVLILIVVEDGLAHYNYERYKEHSRGLNPCCNGQWSRTNHCNTCGIPRQVLILVVVDDGLVQAFQSVKLMKLLVLILAVVDNGLVHVVNFTFKKKNGS